MFILEKPYVSEFLIDTIVQNDWAVLDNIAVKDAELEEGVLNLIPTEKAKNYYLAQEYPLIYGNSENATSWVLKNLPESNLSKYIRLFKDKIQFRDLLKDMYPDFFYQSVEFDELKKFDTANLKFPVIIKPAVGFLSIGVQVVKDSKEWKETVSALEKDIKNASKLYSKDMIDSSKFIIEEFVQGEEFSVDAYFDRDGEPVVLNIYQHPLLNSKDVRNRMFLMSTGIMIKYMAKFGLLLREIGQLQNIRNFPLHLELKVTKDEKIIPIEINPMRFASWCATDVAKYAWGVNVYECFKNQTFPDWNSILSKAHKEVFYYSMIEVPNNIDKSKIQGFEYERFLANYSNVLEVRRINPKWNPLFAVVFGSTKSKDEVVKILSLKVNDYIIS